MMANLPTSSSPIPSSELDLSSLKQLPSNNATSTTDSEVPTTKRGEGVGEPDTAIGVADTNGNTDLNSSIKNITAPLSPPIPTPPFNENFDNSAQEQRAMSNLTIGSPEATSNGANLIAVAGESSVAEQPNTAIPALVDQVTSDIRDQPRPSESTEISMEDAGVPTAPVEPSLTKPEQNESAEPPAAAAVENAPQSTSQDAEMPDAPARVSSPPVGMTSSLIRERSESVEPERPTKRQRTAEAESLPDAAALEHPVATAKGKSEETIKGELPSPIEMDTTTDQPAATAEATSSEAPKEEGMATASSSAAESKTPLPQHQVRAATQMLKNIKRVKDATAFLTPVDPVKLQIPTYPEIVTQPMSIQDMEKKLLLSEYHTPEEVLADFDLMVENTVKFNGVEHSVTQAGRRLQEKFHLAMRNMPTADAVSTPKDSKKKVPPKRPTVTTGAASTDSGVATPVAQEAEAPVTPAAVPVAPPAAVPVVPPPAAPPVVAAAPPPPAPPKVETRIRRESTRGSVPNTAMSPTAGSPTFSLTPSGMPQIRRDSIATADGRPKRPIHPPPSRDLPYSDLKPRRKKSVAEFKYCESIMKELYKKQHQPIAYPFYEPVDPVALEIPDYFKVIKKPMDLSEINRKLTSNEYNNMNEFEADIRLMFNNCYKFNPPGAPVHELGKKLEKIFDDKWAVKPSFKEESPSPAAEDEDEEEEEEMSEDEGSPNLEKLEAQLSNLTKEIESIRKREKSKKASPPASASKGHKKRASVSSVPSKDARKTASSNKKKGGSKRKATEVTPPYMTFAQKHELSERINTLSPAKMHQALNLIKANHPNLAQDGTDEIELDIDELAPATLHKLYKFVSDNTLAPERPAPPVLPPPQNRAKAAPKPRKKNKPMSATEQERKIRELQSQIEGFDGGSPTEDGPRSLASMGAVKQDAESSSDDDSSSGSESEEE